MYWCVEKGLTLLTYNVFFKMCFPFLRDNFFKCLRIIFWKHPCLFYLKAYQKLAVIKQWLIMFTLIWFPAVKVLLYIATNSPYCLIVFRNDNTGTRYLSSGLWLVHNQVNGKRGIANHFVNTYSRSILHEVLVLEDKASYSVPQTHTNKSGL